MNRKRTIKIFSVVVFAVLIFGVVVPQFALATEHDLSSLDPLQGQTVLSLAQGIVTGIRQIATPVAFILIIIAGIMFMFSQGDSTKVTNAKKMLFYTLVGFGIILIGEGFLSLIKSILSLQG